MTAAHSYSCNSGGQFGRRHNKVVFALKKVFETDLGLNGVERETSTCFKPGHTGDRMDLLIPGNQLLSPMVAAGQGVRADKGLMIEFTHCSNAGGPIQQSRSQAHRPSDQQQENTPSIRIIFTLIPINSFLSL